MHSGIPAASMRDGPSYQACADGVHGSDAEVSLAVRPIETVGKMWDQRFVAVSSDSLLKFVAQLKDSVAEPPQQALGRVPRPVP